MGIQNKNYILGNLLNICITKGVSTSVHLASFPGSCVGEEEREPKSLGTRLVYIMSLTHLNLMAVYGEALQLHVVHKSNVFYKPHENLYQVLQVMCMHLNVQ